MIPKNTEAKSVGDYRPIALCNVYYKIISKLLANRFKVLLPELVSENQSAFVEGRAISDNILISHEVLHYLKTSSASKRCSMAVKTDMSKAYDRLEWDFIEEVMIHLGFHPIWVEWIMQCVKTVSYSFLINESAQGWVQPQRGIRQGDPMSPYIFILCSEVLSGLCRKAQEEKKLQGIRVATNSPRVNHLLFADDTLFFCRTNKRSITTLQRILALYEQASGQKINHLKSGITFSNHTPQDLKEKIKTELGIEKEGGSGKYLGCPEHFGRKKKDLFTSIVDRIRQRAKSFSNRFLSTAGKMTLLKSVLSAIPNHSMQCFKLPVSLCKRIQSVLTRFWWDSNTGERKMAWIAWDTMIKSKKDGGLGFRDIQCFNDALLAKLSWRILESPNCLLARVLKGKYYHDQDFLQATAPSSCSHGWRGIIIGRNLLAKQLGWAIGNGEKVLAWDDDWLSLLAPERPMGPIPEGEENLKVSELISTDTKGWDESKIDRHFPLLREKIVSLKISKWGGQDKKVWLKHQTGTYTTKTGYYSAVSEQLPEENQQTTQDWLKEVWKLCTSPKLKLFVWKIKHRAIPVGERLEARQVVPETKCIHCGGSESIMHLFFHCPYASKVWELVPFSGGFNPLPLNDFEQAWQTLLRVVNLPPTGLGSCPLAPWLLWAIWTARNQKMFQSRTFSPQETVTKAIHDAREWSAAQLPVTAKVKAPKPPQTRSPSEVICRSDAAWKTEVQAAGLAWSFYRNNNERISSHTQSEVCVTSSLLAEGLAIRAAMEQAITFQLRRVVFESDSLQLVTAIADGSSFSKLHGVLADIYLLSIPLIL